MPDSLATRFHRHRFGLLLSVLISLQVLPVARGAPGERLAGVLWGLVLVVAVYAASENRRVTVVLAAIAVVALSGRTAAIFAPEDYVADPVEIGTFVVASLFLATIIFMIMRAVLQAPRIDPDTVMGAICVYLLIGYLWANFYAITELVEPGSFDFPAYSQPALDVHSPEYSFGYYSFVTLTTLGYGDITPITYRARALSWMEAVVGVLFLATTIAFLVSQVIIDRQKVGSA